MGSRLRGVSDGCHRCGGFQRAVVRVNGTRTRNSDRRVPLRAPKSPADLSG